MGPYGGPDGQNTATFQKGNFSIIWLVVFPEMSLFCVNVVVFSVNLLCLMKCCCVFWNVAVFLTFRATVGSPLWLPSFTHMDMGDPIHFPANGLTLFH